MGPVLPILVPLGFAALAYVLPGDRRRPLLLPLCGLLQLGAVAAAFTGGERSALDGWLVLDPLGRVVVLTLALLFLFCSWYAPAYLRVRRDRPNRVFCACFLVLLGMLNLVAMAHHLGLMWVALEATTLASAPGLYFNRTPRALEAVWKYLLVCSVGIALALLGSFFLAYAALKGGQHSSLLFEDLVGNARALSVPWLHAAFATLLVGYGTKMGLAPMHTWKPDAYGEAPGIVGAMLAGGVTSCAFVAILRFLSIVRAAGEEAFARPMLIGMGVLSMAFAAVFMAAQKDFKRMLAYSSVEHMGLLVLGAGIGGLALFGALLHVLNNALTKGVLFLSAGNLHRSFGAKTTDQVQGALGRVPWSAGLFLCGFLAITGSPPFGPFLSEFTIVRGAFLTGHAWAASLLLVLLLAVFLGMGRTVLAVVFGKPPEGQAGHGDQALLVLPIALLLGAVLWLGVHVPPPLSAMLQDAADYLEGRP
jgi:hydrogenase-4 component F